MLQRILVATLAVVVSTAGVSAQTSTLAREDLRWFLFVGQKIDIETTTGRRVRGTVDAIFADAFELAPPGQRTEIVLYASVRALRDPAMGGVIQVSHPRGSLAKKIVIGAGLGAAGVALICALMCPR